MAIKANHLLINEAYTKNIIDASDGSSNYGSQYLEVVREDDTSEFDLKGMFLISKQPRLDSHVKLIGPFKKPADIINIMEFLKTELISNSTSYVGAMNITLANFKILETQNL